MSGRHRDLAVSMDIIRQIKRIKIDGKVPKCPGCGDEYPCADIQFDHDTGNQYAVVGPCRNPICKERIERSKRVDSINPKHFFMGARG